MWHRFWRGGDHFRLVLILRWLEYNLRWRRTDNRKDSLCRMVEIANFSLFQDQRSFTGRILRFLSLLLLSLQKKEWCTQLTTSTNCCNNFWRQDDRHISIEYLTINNNINQYLFRSTTKSHKFYLSSSLSIGYWDAVFLISKTWSMVREKALSSILGSSYWSRGDDYSRQGLVLTSMR